MSDYDNNIHVTERTVTDAGSCNACGRHPQFDSDAHPKVFAVDVGGGNVTMGFRVCLDCAPVLLRKLNALVSNPSDAAPTRRPDR